MTTYCRDCRNVHADTRGEKPWDWRCAKAPIAAGYGFVDPDFAPNPPFAKCSAANRDGECPMFEPIPDPNNSEEPRTKAFTRHKRTLDATRP